MKSVLEDQISNNWLGFDAYDSTYSLTQRSIKFYEKAFEHTKEQLFDVSPNDSVAASHMFLRRKWLQTCGNLQCPTRNDVQIFNDSRDQGIHHQNVSAALWVCMKCVRNHPVFHVSAAQEIPSSLYNDSDEDDTDCSKSPHESPGEGPENEKARKRFEGEYFVVCSVLCVCFFLLFSLLFCYLTSKA